MKANELMIGDWVCYNRPNNYNTKVIQIRHTDDPLDDCEWYIESERDLKDPIYHRLDMISCSILSPILLTSEILEKNGFTKYLDTDDIYTSTIGEDMWMYIQLIKDATLVTIDIEKPTPDGLDVDDIFHFFKSDKMYVHELQHILKLCGIDKEIEL